MAAAHARRKRDWLMFLVQFWHALRASEVVALRRRDVESGFITVARLKGSDRTTQPLMQHAEPLLDEATAIPVYVRNLREDQRLFPIAGQQLLRLFRRYATVAGLPPHKRHDHVLKHTVLSYLIAKIGVPATQRWAGHKSGASTLMYTKVSDETAAEAVRGAGLLNLNT